MVAHIGRHEKSSGNLFPLTGEFSVRRVPTVNCELCWEDPLAFSEEFAVLLRYPSTTFFLKANKSQEELDLSRHRAPENAERSAAAVLGRGTCQVGQWREWEEGWGGTTLSRRGEGGGADEKRGAPFPPTPQAQELIAVESTLAGQEIQTPIEESFSFFFFISFFFCTRDKNRAVILAPQFHLQRVPRGTSLLQLPPHPHLALFGRHRSQREPKPSRSPGLSAVRFPTSFYQLGPGLCKVGEQRTKHSPPPPGLPRPSHFFPPATVSGPGGGSCELWKGQGSPASPVGPGQRTYSASPLDFFLSQGRGIRTLNGPLQAKLQPYLPQGWGAEYPGNLLARKGTKGNQPFPAALTSSLGMLHSVGTSRKIYKVKQTNNNKNQTENLLGDGILW